MNTKRTKQVIIRLSAEEIHTLKDKVKVAGISQQEYLRKSILDKKIVNTEGVKAVMPELKRQGNNLNQIAKVLNSRGYVDYEKALCATLKEVKEVWQLLKQYLHTLV